MVEQPGKNVVISPLVQPLSQLASGAIQSRTNNQSGLADFGTLLETKTVDDAGTSGAEEGPSREQTGKGASLPANMPPLAEGFSPIQPQAGFQPPIPPLTGLPRLLGPTPAPIDPIVVLPPVTTLHPVPVPFDPILPPLYGVHLPLHPTPVRFDPIPAPWPGVHLPLRPAPIPAGPIAHQFPGVYPPIGGPRPYPLPTPIVGSPGASHGLDGASPAGELTASAAPPPSETLAQSGGLEFATALTNVPPPDVQRIDAGAIGEQIELISEPWRLQANAGLSYLTIQTDPQGAAADLKPETAVAAPTGSLPPGQLFTFAPIDDGAPESDWLHSLQLVEAGPQHEHASADSTSTAEAAKFTPAVTMASEAWPERLLRWLSDSNGDGATAWVRDYQLNPAQAAKMIDSLHSLAGQQGQQLHRVVLNGHELWRSASTQPTTSRG
jgi:hypothetical protein